MGFFFPYSLGDVLGIQIGKPIGRKYINLNLNNNIDNKYIITNYKNYQMDYRYNK